MQGYNNKIVYPSKFKKTILAVFKQKSVDCKFPLCSLFLVAFYFENIIYYYRMEALGLYSGEARIRLGHDTRFCT